MLAARRIGLPLAPANAAKFEAMDDPPQAVPAQPDLAAAIRQARVENAERADAIADLRELELTRLAVVESALGDLFLIRRRATSTCSISPSRRASIPASSST